jgi:hypothetical protein
VQREGRPPPPASPVHDGGDGLDHREASWAVAGGPAGHRRRDHEGREEAVAQHVLLSSRYVMQKTLRPRGQYPRRA